MRKFLFLAAFVFTALFITGCCSGGNPDINKLIPAGTDLIVDINVKSIVNDPDIRNNMIDPKTKKKVSFDDALSKAKEKTGVDWTKVNRVCFFLDIPTQLISSGKKPTANDVVAGAIASGEFDKKAILEVLYKDKDVKPIKVEGMDVYESPTKKARTVFFNKSLFSMGTSIGINNVIGLFSGKGNSVDASLMNLLNSSSTDSYIKLALNISKSLKDALSNKIPPKFKVIEKINNLMLSYTKVSSSKYKLDLNATTQDKESSDKISKMLNGFLSLGKMMAMSKPAFGKLLESLKIDAKENTIKISLEIDPNSFKDLIKLKK